MAGYEDTRQKIISTLMGRPVGTEIQPENHQDYALNMLDYIRSLELIATSTLIGVAESNTTPVQPNSSRVCYIAGVAQNQTVVFENFIGENGTPISVTTGDMEGVFIILLWNTQYWSAQTFSTNIISQAESSTFYYNYNIKKTYSSVSAMNADKENPIGNDGKYIKVGDIVTVVNSTTPAENGYYSYEGSENGWLLQSGFSFEIVQTTGTDINKTMSQKAVTDELALKAAHGYGAEPQKTLKQVDDEITNKADKIDGFVPLEQIPVLPGSKIQDLSITNQKLGNGSVGWSKLQDLLISSEKIINEAVTTQKINNLAVTMEKLANGAVTETKLGDSSVTQNKLADASIVLSKLSLALVDYINAAGGGTINNNPDDITIETLAGNLLAIKEPYKHVAKQGTITGNTGGNARGANATDFQFVRINNDEVAGGDESFIAGGSGNKIVNVINRGSRAVQAHAEGKDNFVSDWQGHVEGQHCICDGKISHAEGNTCIASANDAHVEGNRNAIGRRYYSSTVFGSEDAGSGLGVLPFILIPNTEGDVSSYFPNKLTDAITTRYGAGAQADTQGNIYPSGMTPAVWSGDTLVTENDLVWALHSICIVRGPSETNIAFADIKKVIYTAGVGTKVYFTGDILYASYIGIYSSYAPTVYIDGIMGGNGSHAEGRFSNAVGYSAHAEGERTRAWNQAAHSEGDKTKAYGIASHARNYKTAATGNFSSSSGYETTASGINSTASGSQTIASGLNSESSGQSTLASGKNSKASGQLTQATAQNANAEGESTIASGINSKSSGRETIASGARARARGFNTTASGDDSDSKGKRTTASGENSVAEHELTLASGKNSKASGKESKASRENQQSYSVGKRAAVGDDQSFKIAYSRTVDGIGWWELPLLQGCEDGVTYHFETMVLGVQIGGTAGTVGDSFAYKFQGCFQRVGAVYNVIGTPIRTLIGRSAGMTGDGLTTGCRVSWKAPSTAHHRAELRGDGVADTQFRIQILSKIQELKYTT